MALLNPDELKRIEAQIALAEKSTSGELVVLVVDKSGDYRWVNWMGALAGIGFATLVFCLAARYAGWPMTLFEIFATQTAAALLGATLGFVPAVRRLVTSPKRRASQVHRECLASFVALGISRTRDRTGILLYVSELERRVEILADQGIHAHSGDAYWTEQVAQIVAGIQKGETAPALCDAIDRLGARLAIHFPPRADDSDELDNRVRRSGQTTESTDK